jgi:hypothetical protein
MDESWQRHKYSVGSLAAIGVPSNQITRFDNIVFALKNKYVDQRSGPFVEMKGRDLVRRRFYEMEREGHYVRNLMLARELLHFLNNEGCKVFASVCFDPAYIGLDNPDETRLDLPFRFLFERIHGFMEREHPEKVATLIMDQKSSWKDNERIAAGVTRFFSRHAQWRTRTRIHRSPYFSSSRTDVGTQLADLVCFCLTLHYSGERYADDLVRIIRMMEYHYPVGERTVHSIRKIQRKGTGEDE